MRRTGLAILALAALIAATAATAFHFGRASRRPVVVRETTSIEVRAQPR